MPDASSAKRRQLNLILTTQRSGSTMLCSDISSFEGLGKPAEHLVGLIQSVIDNGPTSEDRQQVETLLEMGRDSQGIYGLKLMSNHMVPLAQALGLPSATFREALDSVIGYFKSAFSAVSIIYLEREDLFDQAYSRFRAQKTKVYAAHSTQAAVKVPLDLERLGELYFQTARERKQLKRVLDEMPDDYLALRYTECANDPIKTVEDIRIFVGAPSITGSHSRQLKKITREEEATEARLRFRQHISQVVANL